MPDSETLCSCKAGFLIKYKSEFDEDKDITNSDSPESEEEK